MKVGLTYTARSVGVRSAAGAASVNGHVDDDEEEFDSPETIDAIANALHALGYDVERLGDGEALAQRLVAGAGLDFVFNTSEGRGIGRCREAWAPALLELFNIPYTGSDPLTLAATLDKHVAKRLVSDFGVQVPPGILVDGPPDAFADRLADLPLPVMVKPAYEGSSKGISTESVVRDYGNLQSVIMRCRAQYHQPVLVEQFIDGSELTVGIVGNRPPEVLAIMQVAPLENSRPFVYGLDVKRDWRRQVRYEIPAQLGAEDEAAIRHAALAAFQALGCRDVARIDFRLRDGVPYFLEANPLPGLAAGSSDLVLLAEGVGIGYVDLIGRIIAAAMSRWALDRSLLTAHPS